MEDVIDTCPIVAHAVVVGDGKPFVSALIELDPEMLHSWLEGQGLNADMTLAEASDNDAVRAFIQQYIDQANANVSRAESVRKFAVLDEEFSQEHGTLTPSMKVVRPKVLQRYATVIEEDLYAPKPSNKPLARHCQDHRQHAGDRQEILRIGQAGVRTGQTGLGTDENQRV